MMTSPWLDIPLADYESHMSAPEVAQLRALSDLFAEGLGIRRPVSVAVMGIAGGNGLDRIDQAITTRVVGVDVNPHYLETVRSRYDRLPGLELHCVDIAAEAVPCEPVQLVHAALIFEHVGLDRSLESALSLVSEDGACSIVLQLPGDPGQDVGATGIASIQKLKSHFSLIDPVVLCASLIERGFCLDREKRVMLPAGKGLWMGIFAKA